MAAINSVNNNKPETAPPSVQSPRQAGESVSPQQPTPPPRRVKSAAPWTHIVRGESAPIMAAAAAPSSPSSSSSSAAVAAVTEPQPAVVAVASAPSSSSICYSQTNSPSPTVVAEEGSDGGGGGGPNGNASKKPAWKKPANGAVEIGPVMGAESWPALSDARSSMKLSSSESVRALSDAPLSVSVTQGAGTATIASPKQATSSSNTNHSGPTRQRSMKQRNNASVSSNGVASEHPPPTAQGIEVAPSNPPPKEHSNRDAFGSQSHSVNDPPQQRNSFRNRSGGPHPRGDGSHHHNYGGRHQDRGNQEWNNNRNFNNRDNHMHPQRVVPPRGMRPPHQAPAPPNAHPFIPQVPMRPLAGPFGFDFQPPLVYHLGPLGQEPLVPFMPTPQYPMVIPPLDYQLHIRIRNQIDYYFSNENLIKDTFLRRNMDDQGWVRVKLIAAFNKVMSLTDNIQIILDALRTSTVVEVQGDKIRRRNDWMKWVMPATQPPTVSGSQTSGKSANDIVSAQIQSISLEVKTSNSNNIQNSSQPQPSSGDGAGQFSIQGSPDRSISARN